MTTKLNNLQSGLRASKLSMLLSAVLALIKGLAGYFGNSYALIADAIESITDVLTSLVVFFGLRLSQKPADENHPYGHGKVEPMAAAFVGFVVLAAAIFIAVESVDEILRPHAAPAPFTLLVLLGVVVVKEMLFRYNVRVGKAVGSQALVNDAWHHRADSLTSLAAFIGISIALLGGPGYESADDFAALFAAMIIAFNAFFLIKPALYELLDAAPDSAIAQRVREVACTVPGVLGTHKCHVRKLGFDHYVDLDVLCDPKKSIRDGHDIAHAVGEALHKELPQLTKVLVHIEPVDDYSRRSRDRLGE